MPACKPPPFGAGFSSQTSQSPPPPASPALPPLPYSGLSLSSSLPQQPAFSLPAGAQLTPPPSDLGRDRAGRGRAGAGAVWEHAERGKLPAPVLLLHRCCFLSPFLSCGALVSAPSGCPRACGPTKRSVSSSRLSVGQTHPYSLFVPLGWGKRGCRGRVPQETNLPSSCSAPGFPVL